MQRALFSGNSHLSIPAIESYNFGDGDFTVMAMVMTKKGGTIIARQLGPAGNTRYGSFSLSIDAGGRIKFAVMMGSMSSEVVSHETDIVAGGCHVIMAQRANDALKIFVDGKPLAPRTVSSTGRMHNVNSDRPLTVGCLMTETGGTDDHFDGAIMNVSLWGRSLPSDLCVKAAFARVRGDEEGLAGYWSFDGDLAGLSKYGNRAQAAQGVDFENCLDCVWVEGSNAYSVCDISNVPDPTNRGKTQLKLSQKVKDSAGRARSCLVDHVQSGYPGLSCGCARRPQGSVWSRIQSIPRRREGVRPHV